MNKRYKNNIDISKPKGGAGRSEELMAMSDESTTFLPQSITIDDIDGAVISIFQDGDFKLTIDGEVVPAIFLTNERWAEFSKTWEMTDGDKNVVPPYVTIKRGEIARGEHSGIKYNIPNKNFTYIKVPTYDNGMYGYDVYSIPQPTPIDVTYEISFFTRYMSETNVFISNFLKNFQSKQYYINLHGNYFRFEDDDVIDDTDTYDDIDADRYSVKRFKMVLKAYLVDSNDFKVVKAFNRTNLSWSVKP